MFSATCQGKGGILLKRTGLTETSSLVIHGFLLWLGRDFVYGQEPWRMRVYLPHLCHSLTVTLEMPSLPALGFPLGQKGMVHAILFNRPSEVQEQATLRASSLHAPRLVQSLIPQQLNKYHLRKEHLIV